MTKKKKMAKKATLTPIIILLRLALAEGISAIVGNVKVSSSSLRSLITILGSCSLSGDKTVNKSKYISFAV